jgi:hypothetical protein
MIEAHRPGLRYKFFMSLPTAVDIPRELALASAAWKPLRRLAGYASFEGWSLAIFGALTLVCGGYGSASGVMVSIALLTTGIFEIRAAGQLRRLNPSAINRLVGNELVVAAALIAYAMINLYLSRHGGGTPSQIEQMIGQAGGSTIDIGDQLTSAVELFYLAVIVFALLFQGGTALIYLSRRPHLKRYLEQTPDWIQQMQRERGEVSL